MRWMMAVVLLVGCGTVSQETRWAGYGLSSGALVTTAASAGAYLYQFKQTDHPDPGPFLVTVGVSVLLGTIGAVMGARRGEPSDTDRQVTALRKRVRELEQQRADIRELQDWARRTERYLRGRRARPTSQPATMPAKP